jgi:hypothetical protein
LFQITGVRVSGDEFKKQVAKSLLFLSKRIKSDSNFFVSSGSLFIKGFWA